MVIFSTHYSTMEHLTTDNYLKSSYRLFQRTANTRCSLKHLISNTIVHSFNCFVLFTLFISLYFTLWNLCKYFCKYPRMQQYVICNVLKEYCIPKDEEESKCQKHFYVTHWKHIFLTFLLTSLSLYIFTIWKSIVYYRLQRRNIFR